MKLRKILVGLWIVLLLLAGTCYAENTENPIVYEYNDGYYRLDIPSVKKAECLGHYFIEFAYTKHSYQMVPFLGTPYVSEDRKGYLSIDPSNDKLAVSNESGWLYHYEELNDVTSVMYSFIKRKFPNLVNEVIADNKKADVKYKDNIDKFKVECDNDNWEMAYTYLKKVYDDGCQSDSIFYYLAETSSKLGDYDTAIGWNSKQIDLTGSADSYNARAWNYYLVGKNELALEDAKWAVMKSNNAYYVLDTRGSIYYAMGLYDKAIADFNTALKDNDKYAHAYYYRGKCYEALGKKGDAQSDYKKAKKLDPEIIDDKVKFEKERSQNLALKQQNQYQKREKYKEDLKKLNDAVYVHNNASQFPTKDVYESDNVIITVAGNIKNNESEQFYQEVVPQEVRTNYENGVYQQQYEQLKAELRAAEAAKLAAAAADGPNQSQVVMTIKEDTGDEFVLYYESAATIEKVVGKKFSDFAPSMLYRLASKDDYKITYRVFSYDAIERCFYEYDTMFYNKILPFEKIILGNEIIEFRNMDGDLKEKAYWVNDHYESKTEISHTTYDRRYFDGYFYVRDHVGK